MTELTPRGTSVCRGCDATDLVSVLDLGSQPLSNGMLDTVDQDDPSFPLHLRVCTGCGLGQVGEYVLPDRIFGADYPYLSSVSSSWIAHAGRYAAQMTAELSLTSADLVVEVASNDGYLLEQLQRHGVRVLGVEPSAGVAALAVDKGVETVVDFFGTEVAEDLVKLYGRPRLVAANNVMAHVPDLQDFIGGLAALCDDDTLVTVENPSFLTLLQQSQFDTIYHEHFSYLTVHAVDTAVRPFGLELVGVDYLPTHGGSYRYRLARTGCRPVDASVAAAIRDELDSGLLSPDLWTSFAASSRQSITGLRAWLDDARDQGRLVVGYGAAAKGNTIMNAAGVRADDLHSIADGSEQKQGRFMPGSHIPVVPPDQLSTIEFDDALILPWNIAAEIAPLIGSIRPAAAVWTAVPSMQQVR